MYIIMDLGNKYIVIIFGPTAAGKTDFALTLASEIRSEIVNMDIGQFYTPLSIGTAKPAWQSMLTPHHLFDIVDEPRNITVTEYRRMVISTIHEIWQRGNVPILVGGSGFYLKSLLFPPLADQASSHSFNLNESYTSDALWSMLHEIDPIRAARIHKNDTYRIKRALAIWHMTGKKPSEQKPLFNPIAPFLLLHVTREREDLYARINARVNEMMKAGWLKEVEALQGTKWESFLQTKKIIGYDDVLAYLGAERTQDRLLHTIHVIAQKTRNYAKRQETFWRMLEKEVNAASIINESNAAACIKLMQFNLTLSDINLYIEQLLKMCPCALVP